MQHDPTHVEDRSGDHATRVKQQPKKRKSGIPVGNAGEYFVMGELLRRGFDAQLADRNTQGYDLLVGLPGDSVLRKVQVKSVRTAPWYVNQRSFVGEARLQTTIYVLIGSEKACTPVRYFIAKNADLAEHVHTPSGWQNNAFMSMKAIAPHEGKWSLLLS